jgi:hypothetical protein
MRRLLGCDLPRVRNAAGIAGRIGDGIDSLANLLRIISIFPTALCPLPFVSFEMLTIRLR